ncbi:uncharacterized protein C8R40DRAFT_1220074 [Lentinula edodes]|uniref:uncharacterized protein n=1 Tax=Lentinula edodes TaxID=5353 RepID=UPI001E8DD430|nr:uncharacterized protein C8R40DRAFT_1220074 [Lentinula edodes]KAH7869057.1 hypothetical protein C8R40DRAFT_1220074 [Lentinula edodes]
MLLPGTHSNRIIIYDALGWCQFFNTAMLTFLSIGIYNKQTFETEIFPLPLGRLDVTIFQSVISRSFIRAANIGNWHCDVIVATVNFGLSNFGYTLPLDFIVLDELPGYDAIFGLEFQQRCQSSDCNWIFDNLPLVQSSLEGRIPLSFLPPVTIQHRSTNQRTAQDVVPSYASASHTFIPQVSPVVNKLGLSSTASSTLSDFQRHSENEPRSGGLLVPEGTSARNLASPNGNFPHNGSNSLITRENTLTASTSKCHSVHVAPPTSDEVLNACLFGDFKSGLVGLRRQREAVIYHILNAQCFHNSQSQSAPACRIFCGRHTSVPEFLTTIDGVIAKSKAVSMSVDKLKLMLEALNIREEIRPKQPRRQMLGLVHRYLVRIHGAHIEADKCENHIFKDFNQLRFPVLLQYCLMHNLEVNVTTATSADLLSSESQCAGGCRSIASTFSPPEINEVKQFESTSDTKLSPVTLRSVLQILEIPFNPDDNKRVYNETVGLDLEHVEVEKKLQSLRTSWPSLVPQSLKEKSLERFRDSTSSHAMRRGQICE